MRIAGAIIAAAFVAGAFPAAAMADEDFAVTASVGTTGGILEGQYALNDFVQARAGGNFLKINQDVTEDDINYEGDFEFVGGGAFVDLHPFRNSFMLTGGVYVGDKIFDFEATSDEDVSIGDVFFSPAEYGRLVGDTEWENVAPFVGLGYDSTFRGDGPWGFQAIVGAAVLGSGDVTLRSVGGTLSDDPLLQQQLSVEEARIEEEIEDYEYYPVVQLGLSYRF